MRVRSRYALPLAGLLVIAGRLAGAAVVPGDGKGSFVHDKVPAHVTKPSSFIVTPDTFKGVKSINKISTIEDLRNSYALFRIRKHGPVYEQKIAGALLDALDDPGNGVRIDDVDGAVLSFWLYVPDGIGARRYSVSVDFRTPGGEKAPAFSHDSRAFTLTAGSALDPVRSDTAIGNLTDKLGIGCARSSDYPGQPWRPGGGEASQSSSAWTAGGRSVSMNLYLDRKSFYQHLAEAGKVVIVVTLHEKCLSPRELLYGTSAE